MGIAIRNMEAEQFLAVVGDGAPKVLTHSLGREPEFVLLTPRAATAVPFLSAKTDTTVTVQGAAATFDVLVIK